LFLKEFVNTALKILLFPPSFTLPEFSSRKGNNCQSSNKGISILDWKVYSQRLLILESSSKLEEESRRK
jgi:hypothetical protein